LLGNPSLRSVTVSVSLAGDSGAELIIGARTSGHREEVKKKRKEGGKEREKKGEWSSPSYFSSLSFALARSGVASQD